MLSYHHLHFVSVCTFDYLFIRKENTKNVLSCACALVLPILNKLVVFIHLEMFNFLILHLLLIYYNWIQLIIGDKADVEIFFVKCTCSHVCVIVPLNEGACFFVCLLSALLAAIFVLQTLCSICFNCQIYILMDTMCTCSCDIIKISHAIVTLISVASTFKQAVWPSLLNVIQ